MKKVGVISSSKTKPTDVKQTTIDQVKYDGLLHKETFVFEALRLNLFQSLILFFIHLLLYVTDESQIQANDFNDTKDDH